ncbi:MAG: cobalamin-binding protein [Bacteroidota bacterium]
MQLLPRLFSVIVGSVVTLSTLKAEVSVVDDLGRTVTLSSTPHRIISLAPSITETLFAIGSGDQVAGVTDFCNHPPEATKKSRVGGMTNPNIEAIISLKPDLIVLSMEGNVREDFNKLLSIGVPVFVTNPRTLAGIHKSIDDLGRLTGNTATAAMLTRTMRHREDSIRSVAKQKTRVLLIVSLQPLIVVGSKTFLAEMVEMAGGENIAASAPLTYPTLSREAVVAANPAAIIVMSGVFTNTSELVSLFPEWRTLSAVRENRIFRIDADLVSRPGPRAIDGLVALYQIIHARLSGRKDTNEHKEESRSKIP